ncbi:12331_t:CDS:2, partial [Ambispora leptoticha]
QIYDNLDIDYNMKKILSESKDPLFWVPYNEFGNIEIKGKGRFATVYYAMWHNKYQNLHQNVALKLLHNSKDYNDEFMKELKAYCDIGSKNPSFLRCFGISKEDTSGDYILVVAQMEWRNKLTLLHCIASDLQLIHSQELIHRDLHSDLGLAMSTCIALKSERLGVYGILPYIAPEVLDKRQYTTASDIYSLGIIMWEILYGNSASYNQEFEIQLQIEICHNDLRPVVIENTPQCYVNLMKKCWERDPINRPSAIEICKVLVEWQNDENILLELNKSDEILKNINNTHIQSYPDDTYKSEIIKSTNLQTHPDNIYGSKLIKFTASLPR